MAALFFSVRHHSIKGQDGASDTVVLPPSPKQDPLHMDKRKGSKAIDRQHKVYTTMLASGNMLQKGPCLLMYTLSVSSLVRFASMGERVTKP